MRRVWLTFVLIATICIVPAQNITTEDTSRCIEPADTSAGFIAKIGSWYVQHLNYVNVACFMALESSFIPFPSEIIVPPAAYAACQSDSPLYTTDSPLLNILFVILAASAGALIGALINYFIAYFLGRPFIYWFVETKFGRICMLNSQKVEKAEAYFVDHGIFSTLVGRLIPVIRQLISIPAGLAKMKMIPFILFTTLGATIWNIALAILGYIAHGQQDMINRYSDELSWGILAIGGVLIIYFVIKKWIIKKKTVETK